MKKLTIIGGASVRAVFFAHGLAQRASQLEINQLCLYDIDKDKLEKIGALARYAASKINPDLEVVLETVAEKAIENADYFVTTIRVGGEETRVTDEEICFRNGVIGQETTGAGGFFMAARSIPVIAGYCKMIKELAPNAWIFNFTNPSGLVTQALRGMGYDRVIGICDTPSSTKLRIAQSQGINNDDLYMEFFGLNHLSWVNRVMINGEDITMKLIDDRTLPEKVGELGMFEPGLIKLTGHIPNEYLYYYYYRDKAYRNIAASGATRGKKVMDNNIRMMSELSKINVEANPEEGLRIYLQHMFERESSYMSIETSKKVLHTPDELIMPDTQGYAGVAMDFASAVESSEGRYMVLSVPNSGSIYGLRDDDVVEITCKVSQDGVIPVPIGKVKDDIFSIINSVKVYERLAVEAITTQSLETSVKALMAHPLIGSYSIAKSLIKDCMEKYGEYFDSWH